MNPPITERFAYVESSPTIGPVSALPYLPITLRLRDRDLRVPALVDSGSTLNVLPFGVGLQLGADWDRQTIQVALSGNLAASEARALVVVGQIGRLPPVRLAFAWTRNDRVPVILGQTNFFSEYEIRFCRNAWFFEVTPCSVRDSISD